MNRTELLVPEGWKPKSGVRVSILPSKDVPTPPGGVWRVIDRAPSTNTWWLQPADHSAREWARRFPNAITQSCIEVSGRFLAPPGRQ